MANEAVILELFGSPSGEPIRYSVADGTGIEKGTLMQMSGVDLFAYPSAADGDLFAGIASTEKVASDGSVTLGLFTKGIFDLRTDLGAITMGAKVKLSGVNTIAAADDDTIEGTQQVVGVALEASGAAAAETIRVAVGVY